MPPGMAAPATGAISAFYTHPSLFRRSPKTSLFCAVHRRQVIRFQAGVIPDGER
jgi:hypothetical protein